MKKVFIIHGFEGSPNGGWRPWLMGELAKEDVYACALAMPSPASPVCAEWVDEIARHVARAAGDEVCLVGHSLGVPAILRYLEAAPEDVHIAGALLVSGPSEKNDNRKLDSFLGQPFNFAAIRKHVRACAVVHGDNDPLVPLQNAKDLARELVGELVIIPGGGHLNGSSGWHTLPQGLEALHRMFA